MDSSYDSITLSDEEQRRLKALEDDVRRHDRRLKSRGLRPHAGGFVTPLGGRATQMQSFCSRQA